MSPPEVRQCQNEDSYLFGAAAVKTERGNWGVMHPVVGGHWASDDEVADWKVIT